MTGFAAEAPPWARLPESLRATPLWIFVIVQVLIIAIANPQRTLGSDEFNMLITVRRPFIAGLLQLQDYSAPLYELLLRPFVTTDTPPVWLLRGPAFVFSIASVIAAWWFVSALFGRRAAVIALLFLVANPLFAGYSVQARPYTIFVFLSIASMGAFRELIRTRATGWSPIAYATASVLLVYCHYYGFLVIAAQVLFAAVEIAATRDRRMAARMVYTYCAIGAAVIPAAWLISRYVSEGAAGAIGWIRRPERTDLLFARQAGVLFGDEILSVVFVAAAVIAVWRGDSAHPIETGAPARWTWWSERRAVMLCALWIVSGLYLLIWISYFARPIYVARYGLPVQVPLAALLATTLCRIRLPWRPVLVAALLTLPLTPLLRDLRDDERDFTRLVQTLRAEHADRSALFVGDLPYWEDFRNTEVYGLHYYGYRVDGSERLLPMARTTSGEIELRDPENLPRDERVFVVTAIGVAEIDAYLRGQGRAHRRFDFGPLALFEIEPVGAPAR